MLLFHLFLTQVDWLRCTCSDATTASGWQTNETLGKYVGVTLVWFCFVGFQWLYFLIPLSMEGVFCKDIIGSKFTKKVFGKNDLPNQSCERFPRLPIFINFSRLQSQHLKLHIGSYGKTYWRNMSIYYISIRYRISGVNWLWMPCISWKRIFRQRALRL